MLSVRRSLRAEFARPLPPDILDLLREFRLLVNLGVREALEKGLTARGSLVKFAQSLAREHRVRFAHVRIAMDVALSLDKGHRRRLRQGRPTTVPYVHQPFLRADDETFHLNPVTGHVRLSLRTGEWAGLDLVLSGYHRKVLAASQIKQLVLNSDRAVFVLEREAPEPYAPTSLLALDTNERSLDGVLLVPAGPLRPVTVPFPEVARIQQTHFARRRKLGRKKAHDRRVGRRLGGQEGRRERNRVTQRMHLVSNGLVALAKRRQAGIVLEDLSGPFRARRASPQTRRRLSSWPRRELHRQLEYKAEEAGVPVLKVNPAYTSKTCPRCGVIQDRRSRVGRVFVCVCGWRCDRQVNAGLNICKTALSEVPQGPAKVALGGLWLDPDALSDDAMRLLYAPGRTGGQGRSGWRGRGGVASPKR